MPSHSETASYLSLRSSPCTSVMARKRRTAKRMTGSGFHSGSDSLLTTLGPSTLSYTAYSKTWVLFLNRLTVTVLLRGRLELELDQLPSNTVAGANTDPLQLASSSILLQKLCSENSLNLNKSLWLLRSRLELSRCTVLRPSENKRRMPTPLPVSRPLLYIPLHRIPFTRHIQP